MIGINWNSYVLACLFSDTTAEKFLYPANSMTPHAGLRFNDVTYNLARD